MTKKRIPVSGAASGPGAEAPPAEKPRRAPATRTQAGVLSEVLDESAHSDVQLGFLFHDVARMRRRANDQFMKQFGLTRVQWWVLAHLARSDGMTQTALADALETGKSNLGVVIENLETAGWVERHELPSDLRAKRVFLTRAAVSLARRMFQREVEFNNLTLAELSAKERAQLAKMLSKVKNAVSQLDMGPPARD